MKILVLILLTKGVCFLACIGGAVYLAQEGKDGWGWLIFLAIVVGTGSINYTDQQKKPEGEKL